MMNPFKKLKDWNKQRIERNYEKVISQYSPEEQELIRKGRNIPITPYGKDCIEKFTGMKVAYLPDNQTSTQTGFMSYKVTDTFFCIKDYEGNIRRWLGLGKAGADILYEAFWVGPDTFQVLTGRPAVICNADKESIKGLMEKLTPRRIAESMPIEILEEYIKGTEFFGKTIARLVYSLSPEMKARYDVLKERKSELKKRVRS